MPWNPFIEQGVVSYFIINDLESFLWTGRLVGYYVVDLNDAESFLWTVCMMNQFVIGSVVSYFARNSLDSYLHRDSVGSYCCKWSGILPVNRVHGILDVLTYRVL